MGRVRWGKEREEEDKWTGDVEHGRLEFLEQARTLAIFVGLFFISLEPFSCFSCLLFFFFE